MGNLNSNLVLIALILNDLKTFQIQFQIAMKIITTIKNITHKSRHQSFKSGFIFFYI